MKSNKLAFIAAILLLLGVVLGAFGAHALSDILTETQSKTWGTATLYLFVHALGALVMLQYQQYHVQKLFRLSAIFLVTGVIMFSGSLYLLCLRPDWNWLGPVTPLGGTAFIIGWLIAAIGLLKSIKE